MIPHPSKDGNVVADDSRESYRPDQFDTFAAALGEPFDSYAASLQRFDEVDKRLHAAVIAGDVNAQRRAELEREEALIEVNRLRHHAACVLIFGLRTALLETPDSLVGLLDEVLAKSPLIAKIQSDSIEIAAAVANLEALKLGRGAA